jgi:hypothetical protein
VIIAGLDDNSIAEPIPCTARAATNPQNAGENAHANDAPPKIAKPIV